MRRAPDVDLVQVKGWAADLEALHDRIGPRFGRVEPRRRALAYVTGLLGWPGQADRRAAHRRGRPRRLAAPECWPGRQGPPRPRLDPGCAWTVATWPTGWAAGCWPAARSTRPMTPTSRPSTSVSRPRRPRCRRWSRSQASAGRWRSASSRPRARLAWITTRSATGPPGTGISPWPCSPRRIWPWSAYRHAGMNLPGRGVRTSRQLHAFPTRVPLKWSRTGDLPFHDDVRDGHLRVTHVELVYRKGGTGPRMAVSATPPGGPPVNFPPHPAPGAGQGRQGPHLMRNRTVSRPGGRRG
jgi:hypothetical protein